MELDRRALLGCALAAPVIVRPAFGAPDTDVAAAVARFAAIPASASCLVEADHPERPWKTSHAPDTLLFVGSAVKTFILAQYLRDVESGRLSEDEQKAVDDAVRSPGSPVFLNLTGTTPARSVLEAMIAHSDNTATEVALAAVGVERARALIAEAGLSRTRIPTSIRRMFSYLAGEPEGSDLDWDGMKRMAAGRLSGPARSPMNERETMVSTADEMVRWYRRALKGEFFEKPETLTEFKRIQAMADAIALVVPPDTAAYAKGGSIDWQDFHCFSLPGQMVVRGVPVTFCFTINWTGPDDSVAPMFRLLRDRVADVLQKAAAAV